MRKNKLLIIILSVVLVCTCLLISCSNKVSFKVEFDVDGQVYATQEVKKGGTVQSMPKSPVKSGFIFDGWYLDNETFKSRFNEDTVVINDIKVYANWTKINSLTPNTYTVTFDPQGGTMEKNSILVRQGDTITFPEEPTLKDFNFAGWFLDLAATVPFTTDYKVTKDMTVYAKWDAVDSSSYFVRSSNVIVGLTEKAKGVNKITLPETLDGVRIIKLGDGVFKNNTDIVSVTFPSNSYYEEIGTEAFKGCTSLTNVTFINGIKKIGEGAFMGCTALKGVQLSTSLESIPKNLFNGCTALEYATIPSMGTGITEIGDGAFYNCFKITAMRIDATVKRVGNEAFSGCSKLQSVNIAEGVEEIGNKAFYNNASLKSVTVPSSVTKLGTYVFYGCSSLTSATLGSGLISIPEATFYANTKLETLTLSDSSKITAIGALALYDCNKLMGFNIPENTVTIGKRAFSRCYQFKNIVIPQGVTALEEQTFTNAQGLETVDLGNVVTLGANTFSGCKSLTTVTGLNKVTKLGVQAFKGCVSLDNVTLSSLLVTVPEEAFDGCASLKNLVISDGVVTLKKRAFSDCRALETLTTPNTLESIGAYCFDGAKLLNRIVISKSVKEIDATAFNNCPALVSIEVDALNPYFEADGGILYSKGKKDLIFYSSALTSNALALPNTLESIYPNVFKDNVNLVSVTAPSTLERIGDGAFDGATQLTTFNFTENLKYIGKRAFAYTQIPSAVLPIGLVEIGEYAFTGNGELLTATLPITLISLSKYVFSDCNPSLQVTVEGDEEDLSSWSGDWDVTQEINALNVTYAENRKTSTCGLYEYFARDGKAVLTKYLGTETVVTVPQTIDGITVKGLYKTFRGQGEITSVSVPSCVDVISELTFKGLSKITTLTVPFIGAYRNAEGASGLLGYMFDYSEDSHVDWLRQDAEGGNYSKYFVEIPKTLTTVNITDAEVIAYGALSNLNFVTAITLPDNVKTIKGKAFYHCSLVTVYLPLSLETIGKEAFTYNFNRYQITSEGALSPAVTFNIASSTRPEGWVDGCFDAGSILNYAV